MAEELVVQMTANFFKALAHPVRVKILHCLEPGERCVCELIEEIDTEQSNLSQHLSVMKKQGLIGSRKDGQKVFYRILYPSVLEALRAAERTLSEQIGHSQSLLKYLK